MDALERLRAPEPKNAADETSRNLQDEVASSFANSRVIPEDGHAEMLLREDYFDLVGTLVEAAFHAEFAVADALNTNLPGAAYHALAADHALNDWANAGHLHARIEKMKDWSLGSRAGSARLLELRQRALEAIGRRPK
jgi:hypothetical protein